MADSGIGQPSDTRASDTVANWTVISLLKGILHSGGGGGGGGGAVTIDDAADVTQGAIADAAVTAGASGTVNAHLRSISRDIGTVATASATEATATKQDTGNTSLGTIATNSATQATAANQTTGNTNTGAISTATGTIGDAAVTAGASGSLLALLRTLSRDLVANIVLKAGSAIIGQVGVDQTTPGTTDSVTVKASSGIGSLTETAPASDTASSGLNGRLQRIAQNITTLIASALTVVGNVASAATDSGNPVKTGGKYNSTKPTLTNGQRGDTQVEINGATTVALYGKNTNPGDIPILATPAGVIRVAIGSNSGLGDGGSATSTINSGDTNSSASSAGVLFNGATWDRQRSNVAATVLASAARTGTVSTDITNNNARTIAITLNITAAPNTGSTITIQIRAKDSISGNYTTILASAAIVGTATTGVVPVTNRYSVGANITVTANVSASDVLNRTMNVNVVHSDSASWTYSISADLGL